MTFNSLLLLWGGSDRVTTFILQTMEAIQATDRQHVFIYGCDVFNADFSYLEPTLVSTNNRGTTWKNHVIFPHSTNTTYDNYECNGIHFIDSRNGYLIASRHDSSDLMITIDGGITWKSKMKFEGTLTAFEMLDTVHAWIGTRKGLLYALSTPLTVGKHSSFCSRQSEHSKSSQASLRGYLLNGRQFPFGSISASLWQQRFIDNDRYRNSSHISIK